MVKDKFNQVIGNTEDKDSIKWRFVNKTLSLKLLNLNFNLPYATQEVP